MNDTHEKRSVASDNRDRGFLRRYLVGKLVMSALIITGGTSVMPSLLVSKFARDSMLSRISSFYVFEAIGDVRSTGQGKPVRNCDEAVTIYIILLGDYALAVSFIMCGLSENCSECFYLIG